MISLRLSLASAAIAASLYAGAAAVAPIQVPVTNFSVAQDSATISVALDIDASQLRPASAREIILTPVISDTANSQLALFPSVILAGHARYYLHLRQNDIAAPDSLMRATRADNISYSASIPYQPWMAVSDLALRADLRGCACSPLDQTITPISSFDFTPLVFAPSFVTMRPTAIGEKTRELKGSSYIDFPVNRTELYPNYRRNPEELARIRASIDVVRNDSDATITAITIKGFASPEGSFSNNVRLAKGRTQTLRDHVQGLYAFNPDIMHTDWEAEDWAGLRRYVETSSLDNRDAILQLIDSDLEPDAKDRKIRTDFPKDYQFLLKNVYPGLRHSDYTVNYTIRTFTDVNEIAQVMKTNPGKLSLNELFLLAQSLDPESPEYVEVFDVAVRLFPADPVANLNVAVTALRRGDLSTAERYLQQAGNSTQATYARALLLALRNDYARAANLLQPIASEMPEAADALAQINNIIRRTENKNVR